MGLYNLLTTSASGMAAQSALLNTVSDNIANVSTTGYKQESTEFSSLVLNSGLITSSQSGGVGLFSNYQSGGVIVDPRVLIEQQGALKSTTSPTDLAIQGSGFFIVQGPGDQPILTRAGSFMTDSNGNLVNAAGFTLLGYPAGKSGVANGFAGLIPVNLNNISLQATPTTAGKLYVNVPSTATAVAAASLPLNAWATTNATPTAKTSLVTYDNLGNQVTLDVYLTKTTTANAWEVDIFDSANAAPGGGFPYTAGPLTTGTLTFDPTTGAIQANTPTSFNIAIPNGATAALDMAQTTQLATSYTVLTASTNGNAPSQVSSVNIANDGSVSVVYQNGLSAAVYTIPLATVSSPNNMTVITGNAFMPNMQSGAAQIGTAGSRGLGLIKSSALENSTVDLATELTRMIAAQNDYQANSKVFTTGSQLLQVLINLGH